MISYGKTLLPKADFLALMDFWCQNKKAEVLANPKVLTSDGHTAKIELIEEIPYTSSSIASTAGTTITTTLSFREAGIKLDVTPHISVGGVVALSIKTEQSFQTSTVAGQPVIDSRKAETDLLVKDGETIVIGGLKKRNTTTTVDSFPFLGKIPFLGVLFRKSVKSITDSELLIFVSPYIVTEAKLTPAEKKSLESIERLKKEPEEKKLESLPFGLRPIK
jgi:type II secretory pathway component GspD/PulD (secretin)